VTTLETEYGLITDRDGNILYLSDSLEELYEEQPSLLPPLVFESIRIEKLQGHLYKAFEFVRDFKQKVQIENNCMDGKDDHTFRTCLFEPVESDKLEGEHYLLSLEKDGGQDGKGKLPESRAFFEHLLRYSPGLIMLVDLGENIRLKWGGLSIPGLDHINPAKTLEEIVHAEDYERVSRAVHRFMAEATGSSHMTLEFRLNQADTNQGSWVKAYLHEGYSIEDEPHVIIGMYDISDQKDSAQKWDEANQRLRLSNHDLEQFALLASHDLQEPLRTIQGMVTLLGRDHMKSLDGEGARIVEYLKNASGRMILMIQSLLEHSRLGGSLRLETVDCNQLISEVVEDLASLIEEHGAEIRIDSLPTITAYRDELGLLFQNLLSNGIKYHLPGREPEVLVSACQRGNGWILLIEDNGIGIPEEHKNKMFRLFQRFHKDLPVEGTGIGLAHVKKIVDLHHGSIQFQSEPNQGTRFEIFIPRLIQPEIDPIGAE